MCQLLWLRTWNNSTRGPYMASFNSRIVESEPPCNISYFSAIVFSPFIAPVITWALTTRGRTLHFNDAPYTVKKHMQNYAGMKVVSIIEMLSLHCLLTLRRAILFLFFFKGTIFVCVCNILKLFYPIVFVLPPTGVFEWLYAIYKDLVKQNREQNTILLNRNLKIIYGLQ